MLISGGVGVRIENIIAEYEWLRILKKYKRRRNHIRKYMQKYRSIKTPLVVIETENVEVEYEQASCEWTRTSRTYQYIISCQIYDALKPPLKP